MFAKEILSSRLKEARTGLTQAQAAEKAGLSQQGWARYELGKVMPGAEAIHQICSSLQVSADWLLGLTHEKNPPRCTFSESPPSEAAPETAAVARVDGASIGRDCLECPLLQAHLKRFSRPRK